MSDQNVQSSVVETPAVVSAPAPVESPKAPDEMASKFAALAKKERITRQQTQKIRQLEAQIAERERQITERERLWNEEFKISPLEAIKKRGYTYEDLTKAALNDGRFEPATEIKEVRSEIERLRQEQADKEQRQLEQQRLNAERAELEVIEKFREGISAHLEANKDKYELTSLYDAHDLIYQTVEEHFNRTSQAGKPKIMNLDEACELVESYIESEIERTASASKKFQSKYQPMKANPEVVKSQPKSSTTLTNDLVSSSAAPSLLSPKTENDRLKRALAALG